MLDVVGDFIQSVRKFGLETVLRRYYSAYRGQVTDVEDEQNRCRIKVRVPDLFGDEPIIS